jgi:hypothetical protein
MNREAAAYWIARPSRATTVLIVAAAYPTFQLGDAELLRYPRNDE